MVFFYFFCLFFGFGSNIATYIYKCDPIGLGRQAPAISGTSQNVGASHNAKKNTEKKQDEKK